MATASVRDLRNHGGEVIDRVLDGEPVTITKSGTPVAELRPLRPTGLKAAALLARWHRLPRVDPAHVRADIDAVIDPFL
jgi:prevent-host-death family protein